EQEAGGQLPVVARRAHGDRDLPAHPAAGVVAAQPEGQRLLDGQGVAQRRPPGAVDALDRPADGRAGGHAVRHGAPSPRGRPARASAMASGRATTSTSTAKPRAGAQPSGGHRVVTRAPKTRMAASLSSSAAVSAATSGRGAPPRALPNVIPPTKAAMKTLASA